jgi:hypothetical protein
MSASHVGDRFIANNHGSVVDVGSQANAAATSHDPFMFCDIIPYTIPSIIVATYKQREQNYYQQRLFARNASPPDNNSKRRTTTRQQQ